MDLPKKTFLYFMRQLSELEKQKSSNMTDHQAVK